MTRRTADKYGNEKRGEPNALLSLWLLELFVCPESVEVAVCNAGDDLVFRQDGESHYGIAAGYEKFALIAARGLEGDPLDVVLFQHGMGDRTDGNGDDVTFP